VAEADDGANDRAGCGIVLKRAGEAVHAKKEAWWQGCQ
jgi:hypothetical protein